MSYSVMRINDWLQSSTEVLKTAGIVTARLDSLVLLEDVLNTNRTQLLSDPERQLTDTDQQLLDKMIQKRVTHIPLAYIRNKTEFYGREFYVNEHVLEPRPESETMIEVLKDLPLSMATLADIGSGSGALGITAKLENLKLEVVLIEIDSDALAVTKRNIELHTVAVQIVQSDLLTSAPEHFDVLLCNLPYVPTDFHINTAASHEPRLALFGGEDGLDVYRRLFKQLQSRNPTVRYVLTEALPFQHQALQDIAARSGYSLVKVADFIQLFELS